jgi:hypothetical protein
VNFKVVALTEEGGRTVWVLVPAEDPRACGLW